MHHVMQFHDDGAAFYTLARQQGTHVVDNWADTILEAGLTGGYPVAGIYADNYSEFITFERNATVNCSRAINRNTGGGVQNIRLINNYTTAEPTITQYAGRKTNYVWPVKIEAESMTISGGTSESGVSAYSNDAGITFSTNGNLNTTFAGAAGTYNIHAAYVTGDTNAASYRLVVAGVDVDTWSAELTPAGTGLQIRHRIKRAVALAPGNIIRLFFTPVSGTPARVDYVEIYDRQLTSPLAPESLTASAASAAKIALAWEGWKGEATSATFDIFRATSLAGPFTTIATGVTGTTWMDSRLVQGTPYFYRVTMTTALGTSPASEIVSATPQPLSSISTLESSADAGESWGESSITWNNAPANTTTSGDALVSSRVVLLGTLATTGAQPVGKVLELRSAALDAFLLEDTDDRVTFILTRASTASGNSVVASRESTTLAAPALEFDRSVPGFIEDNASTQRYESSTTATTNTISNFTVPSGSYRKLVLTASWEQGNPAGISATWNGAQNFTVAVSSSNGRNSTILYLDDPTPGTGNIVVTLPAATASRVGALSLVGAARSVARTSGSSGVSGSLAAPVDGSFVTGVYTSNGNAANVLPTISGPFATTLHNGNSGSSAGNAGYQTEEAAGLFDYTWTVSEPAGDSTVESFNVVSSPRLVFSGQTLTIDPSSNLGPGVAYHILIDSTAIVDTSGGNAFAGISSPSAWNLTTAGTPVNSFVNWIAGFGLAPADQDLFDDPDGDGIDNGVENFFGTHPGQRPHCNLPLVHRSRRLSPRRRHQRRDHRDLHHRGGHTLPRLHPGDGHGHRNITRPSVCRCRGHELIHWAPLQ